MSQQLAHRPGASDAADERRAPFLSGLSARLFSGSGGALIGLIALVVILSIAAPNFLTARNVINVLDQVTVLGILAVGATAVIITGGIDLSVGSVLGLSTMVLGWLSHQGGWPLGGDAFLAQLERHGSRRVQPLPKGRPKKVQTPAGNAAKAS